MKVLLMHRDRDFEPKAGQLPCAADLIEDLIKDLNLDVLFNGMAAGDPFLLEVGRGAVLASLQSEDEILYRQQILADSLGHPAVVREIYGIAVDAIEREKRVWGWMSAKYPEGTLHRATEVLQLFQSNLRRLREIADEQNQTFHSQGFRRFFEMLRQELEDEYLHRIEDHLKRLEFPSGLLASVELGSGAKGTNYTLLKTPEPAAGWFDRVQTWARELVANHEGSYTYEVDPRDEAGFRALSDLRVQAIQNVARALAQSTDHILSFFKALRLELGFYITCLNLRDQLAAKNEPICFPEPVSGPQPVLQCQGLYDICLSLSLPDGIVGNDVDAAGKSLVIITGANRGGKSTFLRSIGIAQVMMQCGMFVPAQVFRANPCAGVYSHFKREEDTSMKSGKLDEELKRMSAIVDKIVPGSLVLLNESFASTNEREGSEIARQIVRALLENGMKVVYVTHMFDLAEGFYREGADTSLFLCAERLPDGTRTFRLIEGEPTPTSHGEDLYRRIFDDAVQRA